MCDAGTFLAKMYVKMKELDLVGEEVHARGAPWIRQWLSINGCRLRVRIKWVWNPMNRQGDAWLLAVGMNSIINTNVNQICVTDG